MTQLLTFNAKKQASSAKKFMFQNETDLKQISLTKPLERVLTRHWKDTLQDATDLQHIVHRSICVVARL